MRVVDGLLKMMGNVEPTNALPSTGAQTDVKHVVDILAMVRTDHKIKIPDTRRNVERSSGRSDVRVQDKPSQIRVTASTKPKRAPAPKRMVRKAVPVTLAAIPTAATAHIPRARFVMDSDSD